MVLQQGLKLSLFREPHEDFWAGNQRWK